MKKKKMTQQEKKMRELLRGKYDRYIRLDAEYSHRFYRENLRYPLEARYEEDIAVHTVESKTVEDALIGEFERVRQEAKREVLEEVLRELNKDFKHFEDEVMVEKLNEDFINEILEDISQLLSERTKEVLEELREFVENESGKSGRKEILEKIDKLLKEEE